MMNRGRQVFEAYVWTGDMPEAEATVWNFSGDLDSAAVDPRAVNYTPEFLQGQLQAINSDLAEILS